MEVLQWLESTSFAVSVSESIWLYPFLLSMHIIGLSIVVGIFFMLDLKLIGLIGGIRVSSFLELFRIAWTGFVVNVISGVALFIPNGTTLITSLPFLLKIGLVVIGATTAKLLRHQIHGDRYSVDDGIVSAWTKIVAIASFLTWIGVIVAGRLIAYL